MGTMHHIFFFVPHPSKGHERVLDNIKFRDIKRENYNSEKEHLYLFSRSLMTLTLSAS